MIYIRILYNKIFKQTGFIPVKMRKKEKGFRKGLLLPLFVVFIMVMSVFSYMLGSSRTRLTYNGFKFYQLENGGFMLNINNNRVMFSYSPQELERINTTAGIKNLFNTPMVYFTYAQNSTYAETIAEMQFNFAQLMDSIKGTYVQNAFTAETEFDIPAITCKNATLTVPVILFEKAKTTEIMLDDECIVVKAKNRQEMSMAYERLLYSIIGVME